MQSGRYRQYLDLPTLPAWLTSQLNWNMAEYTRKAESQVPEQFLWSDDHNQALNHWAKAHISSDLYFAFQLMPADVPIHKDRGSTLKLNYILDAGGFTHDEIVRAKTDINMVDRLRQAKQLIDHKIDRRLRMTLDLSD
jgi:hypothetical protein